MHGFRGGPDGLEEVALRLKEQGFLVKSLTLPPQKSSKKLKKYDSENYARFVANEVKSSGLKKPIIVGHSMGALVTGAAVEKYPELFSGVILVAPIVKKQNILVRRLTKLALLIIPCFLADLIVSRFLYVAGGEKKFWQVFKMTRRSSRGNRRFGIVKLVDFAAGSEIGDFKLPKKTAVIYGDRDRLAKEKLVEKWLQDSGFFRIQIKGAGHTMNYEQPKKLVKAILACMDELEKIKD